MNAAARRWRLLEGTYAVFDLEMTGLDPSRDRVCELAVIRIERGVEVARHAELVRAPVPSTAEARSVHGLTDERLASARPFVEVWADAAPLFEGAIPVSHNVAFDLEYLGIELADAGAPDLSGPALDTLTLARRLFAFPRNTLGEVASRLGVDARPGHRAEQDADVTRIVLFAMFAALDPQGAVTVGELLDLVEALAPNSPLRLSQRVTLRDALTARQTVIMAYQSAGGPIGSAVEREVGPWKLHADAVEGFCFLRGTGRSFRIERVRSIRPGGRPYPPPDGLARDPRKR